MLNTLIERIKNRNIKIVLPESESIEILKAAEYVVKEKICKIILIGDEKTISEKIDTTNIDIINQKEFTDINILIDEFYNLRKEKGLTINEAKEIITNNYLYFGAMLVKLGYADGMVAGKINTSRDVLKSAIQTVGSNSSASSFIIMSNDIDNILFTDCGLNIDPDTNALVDIAYNSVNSYKLLTNNTPKVAFLSHSTKSSAVNNKQNKMMEASKLFKEKYPEIISDGEIQLDAALNKDVAEFKNKDGVIKGDANILVFPDLDSANIGYKLVEHFSNYKAYGPITQGLNKPINDLSRGSTVEDIIGVIIITCIQKVNE